MIDGIIFSFWQLFFNFFILAKGFDKVFLGEVNSIPSIAGLLFSLNFGLQAIAGAVGNLFAGQLPAFFSQALHIPPESAATYQAILLCSVVLGTLSLAPIFLIHEPEEKPGQAVHPASKPLRQVLLRPLVIKLIQPGNRNRLQPIGIVDRHRQRDRSSPGARAGQ